MQRITAYCDFVNDMLLFVIYKALADENPARGGSRYHKGILPQFGI